MKFLSQRRYFFIPSVMGNENLPENERVEIEIIRATAENHGKLSQTTASRDDNGQIQVHTSFNTREILRSCVGEIRNLEIEEEIDKKTVVKKITTGKELADAVFYGSDALVSQICTEVVSDTITDTEKKT